jgi:hypothetical protein
MTRLLGVALAAALVLIPSTVGAAKPIANHDIQPGTPWQTVFGGSVAFDTEVGKLPGNAYPLVYVACYQAGVKVWADLQAPDKVFVLGAGSNAWANGGGGAADCLAWLRSYHLKRGIWTVSTLAGPVNFGVAA